MLSISRPSNRIGVPSRLAFLRLKLSAWYPVIFISVMDPFYSDPTEENNTKPSLRHTIAKHVDINYRKRRDCKLFCSAPYVYTFSKCVFMYQDKFISRRSSSPERVFMRVWGRMYISTIPARGPTKQLHDCHPEHQRDRTVRTACCKSHLREGGSHMTCPVTQQSTA